MYKCKYCGKEFYKQQQVAGHSTYCKCNPNHLHNIEQLKNAREHIDYSKQSLNNGKNYICQYCGKEIGNKGCLILHEKYCLVNPNRVISKTQAYKEDKDSRRDENGKIKRKTKYLSEEHKEKLRKAYYKWTSENREKFLKYSSGQSEPCEFFKELLRKNNINFIEEYIPYWKERGYRLDIAFPDEKIGIEINGTQHYDKNGNLNKGTLDKQLFFEQHGWQIIQIYYKDVYKENPKCLEDILKLPIRDKHYIKEDFDIKTQHRKEKEILRIEKLNNKILKSEELENKRKEILRDLIENSNIDFSKFGWSNKAKQYLKEHNTFYSNHIFQELRKYFPEFINSDKVFKRKGSILAPMV